MTVGGFPSPFLMNPDGEKTSDSAFKAAQQAQMVSQNFGVPMQGANPGMWANILPAAIQIEEHKKMNEVAEKYQKQYVENFQKRYGFTGDQLKELKDEFTEITNHITNLIPDGDLQTMYKKYVASYPHMYMSMIPPEALQTKLAVKCANDNAVLRKEVQSMSKCVTSLVQSLSKLQMAAGVPPIVSLMFESMPDPLTAITDPMYSSYNDAISTYHKLSAGSSKLLENPIDALKEFHGQASSTPDEKVVVAGESITKGEIEALQTVIQNMGTSSGCQTYGDEWNHTGPEPSMNPAMCLGEGDSMQPGNPRNAHGRTAVYQAKRTQDGGAQWVMKGQVPNPMGQAPEMFGQAQLAQSARYHQSPASPFAGYPSAPVRRSSTHKKKSKTSTKGKKSGRKSSK